MKTFRLQRQKQAGGGPGQHGRLWRGSGVKETGGEEAQMHSTWSWDGECGSPAAGCCLGAALCA